ncbi:Signal transduction histidine kinase [Granulicella pectinivorans]|jgi:signal transduction histidine kinase|uniref:histidine kinase n=1 Tax=Granulicella pectinivorans TaxID=474950 RepID=A0A1I6MRD9_9BACT|nr:ATP-binding protein [Granulicella pectinivorans]SFS18262.1 Signal transduction histidine kinase [Granulicella pectinivorans]
MKNYVSISLRLTLWFGAIFFCGWVIFGTVMWFHLKSTLTAERHQTLSRRADRLQDLLRRDQRNTDADPVQDFRDFAHATGNGLAEIVRTDNTPVYPSPSSAASSFPWPAISNGQPETFLHVHLGDQSYSVLIRPIIAEGTQAYIGLAAPDAGNLLLLHDFWRGLLAWIPALLLVSSAGGYWMSRRALRPVDRITATARSISIGNLSERLPVNHSGDELERLTETCNEMLARLESSVRTIKQFTADASHELRGPLSFARTVAEVALRNPRIDESSRQSFQDIVDEAAKAAVVLEQMLTLARSDAEPFDKSLVPLELASLVEGTCSMARRIAAEKGHTIHLSTTPVWVQGDATSLRRMLWIVLDNALKYNDGKAAIDVAITTDDAQAIIRIQDSGMGISPEDLPYVFDRFYRADPSRSQIEGSGLGLSIARWIADAHHAEISIRSAHRQGTTVTITLPVCDLESPHASGRRYAGLLSTSSRGRHTPLPEGSVT